jgi:predicted transposase/invertase (TIGR01784 family)
MHKQNQLPDNVKIGKFIDPLTDYGFKLLFGSEPNKDLLISFLNVLFKNRKEIIDLTYNKNERNGPQRDYRKAVYDLTCTGKDGEQFIIEVQRLHQPYFKDRALYYTSLLIHDQAPKGKEWDYSLKEVYFIAIMDFSFEDTHPKKYFHRIHLTDEESGEIFYDKMALIFLEIPKFNKREKSLKTDLDRWLFVLKNMSRLEKIPLILRKHIFEKVFNIAEVSNLTKEDYMNYERDLMAYWDDYAIKKSLEHDRRIAMEKAMEKGMEKGMEKAKTESVKNLLKTGKFSISEISNYISVSEAFVRKVKKNLT